MISHVLSIAGSDPSGGAGVQADLKTFSALGAYGMCVLTALTAQNTRGVTGVHEVPATFVKAQLEALFKDIRIDAVKTGMLGSPETIAVIADILQTYKPAHIIVDPVMVAQSGDRLISDEAVQAMKEKLLPMATILTPNLPEAEVLLDQKLTGDYEAFAQEILALGPQAVYLKGGHDKGDEIIDVFCHKHSTKKFKTSRIETKNNHGTGCTLSAALATFLARGDNPETAAAHAKAYITGALKNSEALQIGQGAGPVHHFYKLWD